MWSKENEGDVMLSNRISLRIKELRISKGMTQEGLAEKANIDVSNLGKIERGQRDNLSVETVEKIIKAFDVSYSEFFSFPDTDDKKSQFLYELSLLENGDKLLESFLDIVRLSK